MAINKDLYSQIIDSFHLEENDTVFISSDISNLARYFKENNVIFDVNAVVESIQAKLVNGTLIFPAYTDDLRDGDVFDYLKSKPTTGALSNRIARRKDFTRTFDPLHSVYVWGSMTHEILKLKDLSTFGKDSIFGFLGRENAKFIFIDVDLQNSFTFIHYLEEKSNVSYRKYFPLNVKFRKEDVIENKTVQFHTKKIGISTELFGLQAYLLKNKFLLQNNIGNSIVYLSSADKMTDGVNEYLSNKGKLYRFDFVLFSKQLIKRILGKKYF